MKSCTKSLKYDILFILRLAFKEFRKRKKIYRKNNVKHEANVKRSCVIVLHKNNEKS